MRVVRIVVADDHSVVRRGLRDLLRTQPGWKVVGEAANGREAVEQVKRLRPHVVVLDITMPEMDGLEATRQIVKAVPATQILILTMHESEQLVGKMLKAGARGFVLKSDAGRNLVAAVRALTQHKLFLTSRVSEMVLESYMESGGRGPEPEPLIGKLTPREREITRLVVEGKSNKEVAARLRLSVRTAETHRNHIMHKLGLHTVGELIRFAIRTGLVKS